MSKIKDTWNTQQFTSSPIIKQLSHYTNIFSDYNEWPTLDAYKLAFERLNIGITPVKQAEIIKSFEEQYEPRVFLKKELQTRTENWHDFFNAMIWLKFSETKKTLNHLHYQQASKRTKGSNRSLLENRITQFDECGAIIITDNDLLIELIQDHQWKTLFREKADLLEEHLSCVIFGHAIFEKALAPYIGMTCHCLLSTNPGLLDAAKRGNTAVIDQHMSNVWKQGLSEHTQRLSPFPLLGLPNYWPDQDDEFYNNKSYFR